MSRLAQRVANKDPEMDRPSRGVGDCRQIASPPRRCKATPSTSTAINSGATGHWQQAEQRRAAHRRAQREQGAQRGG
jgi:hypothetical protein